MNRRFTGRIVPGVFLFAVLGGLIWASDRVTLQGERTIYTVDCVQGAWDGNRCSGKLVPGPRYAFRASPRRHEVIYWIRDSGEPSGKFTDCTVQNRDNWTCNVGLNQPAAATYEFRDGKPTRGTEGLTVPFHDVPKWKWWAIRYGLGPALSSTHG